MLHLWRYLWITGTSKTRYMAMALNDTSFRGHGFGFLLLQPMYGVKTPNWSDPNWKFPRKKINHPKPPCQWDFDIDFPFIFFGPIFYGFFPGLERNASVFVVCRPVFCQVPRTQRLSGSWSRFVAAWDSVRGGDECLIQKHFVWMLQVVCLVKNWWRCLDGLPVLAILQG